MTWEKEPNMGFHIEWPPYEEIRVRADLQPFFDALVKEVARHVPEKGYGYKNPEWAEWFIERALTLVENYNKFPENHGEALDIAAMVAFAWSHQEGVWPINNGEQRREQ